ncbi:MAG: adenylyltransferase/cytidyltransferase family protein [Zetaproteobacteria bacterium]|nr:adenylyltransferase/cytidyltransferase family protein [Zetaproteobacteria bacterium]
MQLKYGVIICRVQPFHNAHQEIFEQALKQVDKLVVILGSATSARSIYNPWTPKEREQMITACFQNHLHQLVFVHAGDYPYSNETWLAQVNQLVGTATSWSKCIQLFGHRKDHTSDYLEWFPNWGKLHEFPSIFEGLSATQVRESYFHPTQKDPQTYLKWEKNVPPPVKDFLLQWKSSDEYHRLCEELEFFLTHRSPLLKLSEELRQPITFDCISATLTRSGHLLLEKRVDHPGQGQWCLPEVPIQPSDSLSKGLIYHLIENLGLEDIDRREIQNLILKHGFPAVFDNPRKSQRGRTIKHVWNLALPEVTRPLPHSTKQRASWFPLSSLPPNEEWYDDHRSIALELLKI